MAPEGEGVFEDAPLLEGVWERLGVEVRGVAVLEGETPLVREGVREGEMVDVDEYVQVRVVPAMLRIVVNP